MILVLVVEDEPVAAEAHRQYVERVAGFTVAGVVHSGAEALRFCERHHVDLILLDFYLPDTHGLAVCRALRAAGSTADVIAVTSARDLTVVKAAVSAGVVQYLLKPFTFASLREKLDRYAQFRQSVGEAADQTDVDRALATLRTPSPALPKGMSPETRETIVTALREGPLSAGAAAEATGVSRVTARRYLEHLADAGQARREPRYGQVGRPEVWYHAVT
ncbi:response regulator [Amycolatopsis sp.]|uniref:response regulator n=1 Tax=Amycolatopsis sp. TaxID=37632 RepID=UPI002BC22777|nr:response regulator [Amycolatopsis sp.]HVV12405.1 response regulator [Amycolatopsis sp.]